MFIFSIHIILLSIACVFGQYQKCADCIVYSDCQEATRLVRKRSPENDQILRNALCGFEGKTPKVCCDKLTYRKIDLLPQDCGIKEAKKTFDSSTGLYEFPWMTILSYRRKSDGTTRHSCAGTIINSRYILTAAHCVQSFFGNSTPLEGVRIGEHNLETTVDCVKEPFDECESNVQDIKIEKEIIHERYLAMPILHDIALLRLQKEINFTLPNAKAICLPLTSTLRKKNITNKKAQIAGWGTSDAGEPSSVLVSTEVPVRDNEDCRKLYNVMSNYETMDNKLCAGGKGQSACAGDSGAPLMISGRYDEDHRADSWIQYGIVSYGTRDCDGTKPGVYTDVTKYVDWILDNIQP